MGSPGRRAPILLLLVTASGIALPQTGAAQSFEGARLLSLGGAQRALSAGNDSIYINPAGLALARSYALELNYLDDLRGGDRRFNGSVVDSQAGPISGGIAYTYIGRRPEDGGEEDRLAGHRVDVALALPVADTAAIGVTARYLTFDRTRGDVEQGGFRYFTIDAGLQWRIVDGLAIGIAGYNLTNPDQDETPISFGGGIGYQADFGLSIEADVVHDVRRDSQRFAGALGYVISQSFPVRLGISYDRLTGSIALSGGLGAQIDRIGVDIGFRHRLNRESGSPQLDERIFGLALRALVF